MTAEVVVSQGLQMASASLDDVPPRRRHASYPEALRNDPKHDVFLNQDTRFRLLWSTIQPFPNGHYPDADHNNAAPPLVRVSPRPSVEPGRWTHWRRRVSVPAL